MWIHDLWSAALFVSASSCLHFTQASCLFPSLPILFTSTSPLLFSPIITGHSVLRHLPVSLRPPPFFSLASSPLTLLLVIGTHDLPLLSSFLRSILLNQPTHLPIYDKSAHSGLGDRAPPSTFPPINDPDLSQPRHTNIRVLLLEGWLTGFRSLPPATVEQKYLDFTHHKTLSHHKLEHLLFVNEQLKAYEPVWDQFDAFIHIDAQELEWVYEWRLEQEEQLRRERGTGMSSEMVKKFVDGYFPAYELYEDGVREGVFRGVEEKRGRQLRLVVGRDRSVVEHMVI